MQQHNHHHHHQQQQHQQQGLWNHHEDGYQHNEQQLLQHTASILTFPQFLQLPHEIIAHVAACLPCKDRLQLGRRVLGRAAPAVAAAVLGTITELYVQPVEPLSPHTATLHSLSGLGALQCLQHLNLGLRLTPDSIGAALAVPSLTSLTGLTTLTSLQLTARLGQRREECFHDALHTADDDVHAHGRAWQLALLQALGHLTQLKQLKVVTINHGLKFTGTPAAGAFAALSALTCLRSLELKYGEGCQSLGLGQLSTLTGLTELSLTERTSGEYGVARAKRSALAAMAGVWPQLPCLQRLNVDLAANFSSCPDIPASLQLPQPGNLTHLCLNWCKGFFPGITAQLALLTGLQQLKLCSCSGLSAGDLAAALPLMAGSLTYLDISQNDNRLEGCLLTLTSLTKLACLRSEDDDLATDDVSSWQYLSRLTSLTSLAVGSSPPIGHGMPAAGTACLSALTQLKDLDVTGGVFQPDEAGLAAVFAPLAGTLTSLHLYDTNFGFPELDDHAPHDKLCNCYDCSRSRVKQRLSVLLPGLKLLLVQCQRC
eukprot:gene2149-biopygen3668